MSSMQQGSAQEAEVVQGTVVGIIQKGVDKWQVAVQPPESQYSKNLWTKDQALVQQLSNMIGSQQAFMCGVSHWTRQDGQAVRSLWINGVGPGAAPQAQAQAAQQWGQAQQADAMQTVGQVMQQSGAFPLQQPATNANYQPVAMPKQGLSGYAKDINIMRQCATKVASMVLGHLPPETPRDLSTLLAISERLVAYYEHGVATPAEDDHIPFGPGHPDDDVPY